MNLQYVFTNKMKLSYSWYLARKVSEEVFATWICDNDSYVYKLGIMNVR
jgi:hypothetical protein